MGDNRRNRALAVVLLIGMLAGVGGCTRAFFRKAADKEVNDIFAERDRCGPWKIDQFHIYPDPRSRAADPTNPDRPPMPPDDQATYQNAPHPQVPGKAGVARVGGDAYLDIIKTWDTENRGRRDGPAQVAQGGGEEQEEQQPEPLPAPRLVKEKEQVGPIQEFFYGPQAQKQQGFLMTLEQSVELGLINSREYQSFREDLYLAALPVTQQRFSFAWQFAATEQAIRQWAGPLSAEGHQNNWALGSTFGVSKLFSTGALLTAAFTNNTVINFLGAPGSKLTSTSLINLDAVQPLLRGGGKAVTLEPLTQAERTLYYSIRSYYRFREQFYVSIALGATLPGSLPAAVGTGTGGNGPISTLAALGIASTDVQGQFRGYLPSLYRQMDLAVDRKYVADLQRALRLFEGFQEGGQVAPLQVLTVRSTLLNAQNGVLKDIQDTTNALDQFKLQLGVPANLPLILDDTPSRPITVQLDRYYAVLTDSDAATKKVEQQEVLPAEKLRGFLGDLVANDPLVRGTGFRTKIGPSAEAWAKATDKDLGVRLDKIAQERRRLLDIKTDYEVKGQPMPTADALLLREADFESDLGALEQILRRFEAKSWEKLPKDRAAAERNKQFRFVSYAAQNVLVWARNDRFDRVGQQWPDLPKTPLCADLDLQDADVDRAQEAAVQTALADRVDLMNARAQVVDAWRQLRVTANALMGVFNVQYHLDSVTPPTGTNPLAFATSRTNSELILTGQLPLVRLTERNAYRAALINYQRERRNLINLEDNIAAQVRFDVRQLHLFAANYKIQQKVLEAFYSQVESALEVIVAPVDPDSLKQTGTGGQANAAALTNQYLQALGGLNGAQAKMYDLWLSYQATRMQLYLDLERLPLDNRGVWTDETGSAQYQPASGNPRGGDRGPAFGQPSAGERGGAPAEQPARPRFLAPAAAAPLD